MLVNAGMIHIPYLSALRLPILPVLLLPLCAAAEKVPVGEELERLSAIHGFNVVGLDATGEAVGRSGAEELYPRLRTLLENFDHVIVQSPAGGVERVIVLGEKVPFVPGPRTPAGGPGAGKPAETGPVGSIALKTERRGTQHSVEVSLEGEGGKRISRSLLVDTGADFVVVPASLIAGLGIAPEKLKKREMQTANGKVEARLGRLSAVWLGEHRIPDVTIAFIEDGKLGNGGLLGMSVLGRYTMTIDDEAGRLTLAAKGSAGKAPEAEDPAGEEAPQSDAAKEPNARLSRTPAK